MNVLFLTHEPLTSSIAGPSIRVWELAHLLAREHAVTIAAPNEHPRQSERVAVRSFANGAMPDLVRANEITIAFGYLLHEYPVIRQLAPYLVMDVYGPFVLENLHMYADQSLSDRMAIHERGVDVVLEQLEAADFFICASERQRDYWLGALTMANRVNPYTSVADPSLRSLIDVVPFGLSADPPRVSKPGIKGVVPGIGKDDVVALWTGGVWDWFDPLTAIEAVARLKDELPQLKLFFMGVRHPNPQNPAMAMAVRAEELARKRGVLNRAVFFNQQWVPYEERANYLCDADFAISLHHEHVETRFSFRTRYLDCLWAGLPIVATRGDVLSAAAVEAGAGIALSDGDVESLVAALRDLTLDGARRQAMRAAAARLSQEYRWERVARPLLQFCREPRHAADAETSLRAQPRLEGPGMLQLARTAYRLDGWRGVSRRGREHLSRWLSPLRQVAARARRRVIGVNRQP